MISNNGAFRWEQQLETGRRATTITGYAFIALFVMGFGYWAATAPISGAAIAPGVIAAAGRNVPVQHVEGGTVTKVAVREGDLVEAGDELIWLDETLAQSDVNRLILQATTFRAISARLTAERDGLSDVPNIETDGDPAAIEIVEEQHKEFAARLKGYRSEQVILRQRQEVLREALVGLQAQDGAISEQLKIVEDELQRKGSLLDQGLTSRFEYTQIERNKADLIGRQGVTQSEIAATKVQIIEASEQIERLATQRVEQAVAQLNETRASLVDIEERLAASEAVLDRKIITAPTTGIVVSSEVNAIGIVVTPGQTLLDILPTTDDLVVEAQLRPQDIDKVTLGQTTKLRLTALNVRLTPEVDGEVIHISADSVLDEVTGEPHYRARIRITDNLPPNIDTGQLYPGMPVETFIQTGDRTFVEYLTRPMLDAFSRAFVER